LIRRVFVTYSSIYGVRISCSTKLWEDGWGFSCLCRSHACMRDTSKRYSCKSHMCTLQDAKMFRTLLIIATLHPNINTLCLNTCSTPQYPSQRQHKHQGGKALTWIAPLESAQHIKCGSPRMCVSTANYHLSFATPSSRCLIPFQKLEDVESQSERELLCEREGRMRKCEAH